ncbi:hypothetical protein [Maritimibacter sp. HL-12]|jgi:hypothetical protein|uniref:hypothetical protein n=1 Tax=Maritimibacter sp. HL-12 TaxID=1162418 RepID=UPI000A0EF42C|nr:hypothetical protein [Maritimibacter sp. HL-12]SMH57428.1 hypothetical protein SAMN05661107_3413 [Maritimibacter sp. HL-12]
MTRLVIWTVCPILLWAVHFGVVFALISATCGPRALMTPEILRATVSLVTVFPALGVLALLVAAARRRGRIVADTALAPEASLAATAYWTATISLLAILLNAVPVAVLSSCSG